MLPMGYLNIDICLYFMKMYTLKISLLKLLPGPIQSFSDLVIQSVSF